MKARSSEWCITICDHEQESIRVLGRLMAPQLTVMVVFMLSVAWLSMDLYHGATCHALTTRLLTQDCLFLVKEGFDYS